jgi:hypothetical protein
MSCTHCPLCSVYTSGSISLEQQLARYAQVRECLRQASLRISDLRNEERRLLRSIQLVYDVQFAEPRNGRDLTAASFHQIGTSLVGYRLTGMAVQVQTGVREARAIEQLSQLAPYYLRTRSELARARMLADRNLPQQVELLERVGIRLEQRSEFEISTCKASPEVFT